MVRCKELDIIGDHQVSQARECLVEAILTVALGEPPSTEALRTISQAVAKHLDELSDSVREHVMQVMRRALPPTYSPAELAENWGITQDKVLSWIHSGELEAVDVSQRDSNRPRYRIDADAIAKFKAARISTPPPAKPARRRRTVDPNIIEYF